MHNADLCNHDYYVLLNFSHGSHTGTSSGFGVHQISLTSCVLYTIHKKIIYSTGTNIQRKELALFLKKTPFWMDFVAGGGGGGGGGECKQAR